MQNYRLTISYDGTDFHGWQRQPDKRTIQSVLEDSLFKIAQKKIHVFGAGRTDAGVHAQGQVANFNANLSIKNTELLRALNSILPGDVKVFSLKKVNADFHARKNAISKIYQYRIFNSPNISPFIFRYTLHRASPLKIDPMKKAAALFIREADFTSFSSNRLLNPVRKVKRSEIKKKGSEIIYTVEANGFLRYMVRTMVGTLLEIGKNKIPPEKIEEIFRGKKRSLASPTAPAKGLCLVKVNY
ncbi:MAG: tRNA pseudouridine(38-40) synthase TruA [Candidatus Aminicenantes bacterium]|nr:tRNA pseudouridine(38-40) synthase TruA [Candidatus Aminicenantes bacterium]MBL7083976.1 tRNA pseudouridine(38-40) synthase TruA [Candidatus Aminicenantes bacterium]